MTLGQGLQYASHRTLARLSSQLPTTPVATDDEAAEAPVKSPRTAPLRRRPRPARSFPVASGPAPSAPEPGVKTGYRIPEGGLFRWVSCPHYLAEIVIYVGFALMQHRQRLPLVVLAWVVRCGSALGTHANRVPCRLSCHACRSLYWPRWCAAALRLQQTDNLLCWRGWCAAALRLQQTDNLMQCGLCPDAAPTAERPVVCYNKDTACQPASQPVLCAGVQPGSGGP